MPPDDYHTYEIINTIIPKASLSDIVHPQHAAGVSAAPAKVQPHYTALQMQDVL